MHADLFDEQTEEFFGLFGAFACDDLFELVGERGEGGAVGRRVGLCREAVGQSGFLLVECLEPVAVASDALLAERGRELAVLEGFEVAFELPLEAGDLVASGAEPVLELRTLALDVLGSVGEGLLDHAPIAVELGELGEDSLFEPLLRESVAFAFGGAILVAGGAGVVGVAAAVSVR